MLAQSASQDALIQLTIVQPASPSGAVAEFVARDGMTAGPMRSHTVNGLPAASTRFSASTRDGVLSGLVTAVAYDGRVYRMLGIAAEARWGAYEAAVARCFETFGGLTDRAALAAQPLRLEMVTLDRSMTLREFSQRYPSQVWLEALALLNGVDPAGRLAAGRLVKRVVGGPLP